MVLSINVFNISPGIGPYHSVNIATSKPDRILPVFETMRVIFRVKQDIGPNPYGTLLLNGFGEFTHLWLLPV